MVYTNPQSASYTQEVQRRGVLERHFRPDYIDRACRQSRFQLKLLSRFCAGKNLFDFGCGAGCLVHVATEHGWSATGYDLNSGLVNAGNEYWKYTALYTGPFDDFCQNHVGHFDAIVSNQVFEHLQDPVSLGRKLVELLRPGGFLFIDVPNVYQITEWLSRGKTLDPTSHWCHFSTRTLSKLVQKLQCDVVYCSGAPSFYERYHRLGFKELSYSLGMITKSILPPIGSGVCVIGRKLSEV